MQVFLVPYCYCIFCALLFLLYQLRFCYNSRRAYRRLLPAPNPPPPPPPPIVIGPLYLPRRISLGSHIHVIFIRRNAPPEILYYCDKLLQEVSSLKLLNSIVSDYRNCKTEIKKTWFETKWQFHVIKLRQFFPFLAFCKRPDNGKFQSWYSDELTAENAITAFAKADKTAGQSRNYRVITHNMPLTQRHKY